MKKVTLTKTLIILVVALTLINLMGMGVSKAVEGIKGFSLSEIRIERVL